MLNALKNKLAEKANRVVDYIKLPEQERNERYSVCQTCEHLTKDFCKLCGCYMPVKTYMPNQSCPVKKWVAVDTDKKG
jgi:hypothetical protein